MKRPLALWVFYLILFVPGADAQTLDALIDNNKLSVEIRLQTQGRLIVRQPVVFEIEVATQRWFGKGTRVINPTVKNAVLLPASGLGINSTKRIMGTTWASQLREITLYPTREGRYELPAIEVSVSVNTENFGIVEGRVYTEPLLFEVEMPAQLRPYEHTIVSPDVSLNISFDTAEKEQFAVGEAVTQTITLVASGVPGMMLPVIKKPFIEGVSIYHKPPDVSDLSFRGSLTGSRVEVFTFIFEREGEYQLPAQSIYWWNLESQELVVLAIPERTFKVSGTVRSTGSERQAFRFLTFELLINLVLSFLLTGFSAYALYRYRHELIAFYKKQTNHQQRKLRRTFLNAIQKSEYLLACQLLQQIHSHSNSRVASLREVYAKDKEKLALLNRLHEVAYGVGKSDGFTVGEGRQLLQELVISNHADGSSEKCLQLNPLG